MNKDYTQHLDVAVKAARRAGSILTEAYGKTEISEKSAANLVTKADLDSEAQIVHTIKMTFPDHAFLGEEGESGTDPFLKAVWIIDPLDGTNNYAHQIPQFAVSIAYAEHGEVKMGVIFDPIRNELFTAIKNEGSFMNGQRISVSQRETLQQSIIASGFFYDRGELMERTLDSIRDLFHQGIRGFRRLGAAALDAAWVACGRLDGFFEYQLEPWDYAAGALLVREAGGQCAAANGQRLSLHSKSCLVANAHIFQALGDAVAWEGAGGKTSQEATDSATS